MQVTKGTWHMCEQCVPGSLSSSPTQEPGNEASVVMKGNVHVVDQLKMVPLRGKYSLGETQALHTSSFNCRQTFNNNGSCSTSCAHSVYVLHIPVFVVFVVTLL